MVIRKKKIILVFLDILILSKKIINNLKFFYYKKQFQYLCQAIYLKKIYGFLFFLNKNGIQILDSKKKHKPISSIILTNALFFIIINVFLTINTSFCIEIPRSVISYDDRTIQNSNIFDPELTSLDNHGIDVDELWAHLFDLKKNYERCLIIYIIWKTLTILALIA